MIDSVMLTEDILEPLGVTSAEATVVVLPAVGIALTFLLLLRMPGQRSVARMSTFDVAVHTRMATAHDDE